MRSPDRVCLLQAERQSGVHTRSWTSRFSIKDQPEPLAVPCLLCENGFRALPRRKTA